jgi:hypothetical protein
MIFGPTMLLAVALTQAGPLAEPDDHISDHVITNIRFAVQSATSAAVVTVTSSDGKRARLHVDEVVLGTLPDDVEVSARAFAAPDVAPGTRLLVFFRGKDKALAPTGHYELVAGEKIREYVTEVYVARTRFEAAKLRAAAAKPAPAAPEAPAAPVHASAPPNAAGT